MPCTKPATRARLYLAGILTAALTAAADGSVRPSGQTQLHSRLITCDFPVRLTHDCSIWQGATRPIAFGDYRMTLAADHAGRTILISQLRPGPSHNSGMFDHDSSSNTPRYSSRDALHRLETVLENRGIRLERMLPVKRGRRIEGYFLEFSDNAYDYLKQFTVLESEYWLPRHDLH